MKKTITLILAFLLLCFGLSACTDLKNNNDDNDGDGGNENSSPTTAANILVPYFSCTGNTEKIAEMIARETVGALHEIQPQIPYTEAEPTGSRPILPPAPQSQTAWKICRTTM